MRRFIVLFSSSMRREIMLLCLVLTLLSTALLDAQPRTENVFLITIDGLRWQEVFTGADRRLMNEKDGGVENVQRLKENFWREAGHERREALMPFFWQGLMKHGIVYGNRNLGSDAKLTNDYIVSYPGYAEILAGFAQKEIVDNERKRIQSTTILEFVKKELDLGKDEIAAFTSWDCFPLIVSKTPDLVYCNAGYVSVMDAELTETQRWLNRIQEDTRSPWNTVRHDVFTFYQGMQYIKKHEPRVFYFAFGEADDWAHEKRYDRVLEAAHRVDRYLKELWFFLLSNPRYRGKTSLVITTDHGRGSSETEAWTGHGKNVKGSEFIWIAVVGPDTPKEGELSNKNTVFAKDIAPTIAKLLGLDFRSVAPNSGSPLPAAIDP